MEQFKKISKQKGVLLSAMFVLITSALSAQQTVTEKIGIVAKDNLASFYIIGSVIVFGIIAYIIYNKASNKENDGEPQVFNKHSHPRHHRRVIRKSA